MKRRTFLKLLGLGSIAAAAGGVWATTAYAMNPYYRGPRTGHFDGTVFFNPGGAPPKGFGELLKWQLFEPTAKWPVEYPSPHAGAQPSGQVASDELVITMIGHATLLIQTAGLNIITDPVYADRASPFQFAGPKRINPPGVLFADLPKIDAILLSHNHYDHFDLASLSKLVDRDDALIITPLGNDAIIKDKIPNVRTQVGDWGDVAELANQVKIHFEPMHHWSARGARDRRMALWSAFVIEAPAGKTYVVGDTGYNDGANYKAAADKHGRFKAAIIPIGAYSPRWFMEDVHQNPEEAVDGHILCGAETSIAHHWGTFKLTNEPLEEPIERLAKALEEKGLKENSFLALRPGQAWSAKPTTS